MLVHHEPEFTEKVWIALFKVQVTVMVQVLGEEGGTTQNTSRPFIFLQLNLVW